MVENKEEVPKIFISYSHDSPDHKKWVGELASRLVKNGVDVILDQWDLGLGDDITKFMETSVTESDRVLMICTETYVRKANEGKGGVGYEAMIVSGELVRDLGTSKFIPVVKQKDDHRSLPKSVSTRFYVDLSDAHNFDDQFELLLHELHKVPISQKPQLGKNPFSKMPSGTEVPLEPSILTDLSNLIEPSNDISSIYNAALDIARKGDLVAWRRMIKQARSPIPDKVIKWRNKYETNLPGDIESLHKIALEGANIYAMIFSIALAGIESGREMFANQISLIDEILNPRGWNHGGLRKIVDFPNTIACIYQALNGSMCLQTHQVSLATKLARTKVTKSSENISLPLYKRHGIVGWPETLGRNSKDVWSFLVKLPEKWNWLTDPFGSIEEYRESLCAYYLALNIIEFVDDIAVGNERYLLQNDEIALDVPLSFMQQDFEILSRAYRLLLIDPSQIRDIWESKKIKEEKVKELWPRWIYHLKYWISRASIFGFDNTIIIHEKLFDDLE